MRYIRFLKTPRVICEQGTARNHHVYCLVTITSDLGDSFFPHDAELVAELIKPARDVPSEDDEVLVWRTAAWSAGMRTLAITLPLRSSYAHAPFRVRVGIEHGAQYDTLEALSQQDAHGIVSAWSADFNRNGVKESVRLVERRFKIAQNVVRVWEETGESIARHLWDAGIMLSCQMAGLQSKQTDLSRALSLTPHNSHTGARLNILELGTGCGIVGMTLASLLPNCAVHLSDLPEAREIVEKNIAAHALDLKNASSLSFLELDWDDDLPSWFARPEAKFNLVLAADCTYNADSSPALVDTLRRLADLNREIVVGIAMKMRHESERVFFHLMAKAGFKETALLEYPLPGDVELGADTVFFHVYRNES